MKEKIRLYLLMSGILATMGSLHSCSEEPVPTEPPPPKVLAWRQVASPTGENLNDIWGASANSVYAACTNGILLHFNGSKWDTMSSCTTNDLQGIWGDSDDLVFAVGLGGTILKYNGTEWSSMLAGTFDYRAVWGGSNNAVYAVGDEATVEFYDGSYWTYKLGRATRDFYGVWGSAENNVYMFGDRSLIFNYNGIDWNYVPYDPVQFLEPADVRGIRKSGTGDPMLLSFLAIKAGTEDRVAMEFDLDEIPSESKSSIQNVYLDLGLHNMDDGGTSGKIDVYQYLTGADGVIQASEFYSGTYFTYLYFNVNKGFAYVNMTNPVQSAIAASKRYIGIRLSTTTSDRYNLGSMGSMPDPAMVVSFVSNPPKLRAAWGTSKDDVYIVGGTGTIIHYDGASWSTMDSGIIYDLYDIWGYSEQEIFAVGENGKILYYDGSSWAQMDSGTMTDLYGVWGSSGTNVYAVGQNGLILRYSRQ